MGRVYRDEGVIKKVGERIGIIIKEKGITHAEFQDSTGLCTSRVISGQLNMTISTLAKIADYLDIPINDLTQEQ